MNLRALQLFRNIVLTGSLTEAGERIGLSASAASRLLGQLEEQVQLTLFSRSRRNLQLTEDGARFYQQIGNTLDGIEEIPAIARDIRDQGGRHLSVVTAPPLANALVVPAVTAMRAGGAGFNCNVQTESRFGIESKVAARGYNLGVISLPVQNEIIALDIMPLIRARYSILMPEDHPLATREEVTVQDLATQPLVSLTTGQLWRNRLEEVMGDAGLRTEVAFQTGSTLVTVEMVRHGLGLTLIDPVCVPATALGGVTMRPLAGDHWLTYASIRAQGPQSDLAEGFLDALSGVIERRRADTPALADLVYLI